MSKPASSSVMLGLHNRGEIGTLLDAVGRNYESHPDATALIFLPADGSAARNISTRAFFGHAARYAAALEAIGIQQRDLVVLVVEHSESLLYAFWGALLLGAVPSIFPFLSDKLDPHIYFERVRTLITHSGVRAVIASSAFVDDLTALLTPHGVAVISDHALPVAHAVPNFAPSISGDDIAFLQHSSGTTGLQKGVALTHGAVLNQIASYSAAIRLTGDDVIVSWLPLYHDMGLIAGFVLPVVQGLPLVLMSPFHWVRDPKILLKAIHRYGGTLCWLPNFAYNFMATRVRDSDLDGLNLHTVRAFVNCSEPMRTESHRQFASRYTAYGLDPAALTTCYAMAENTFAVTQGGIESPATIDVISRAVLASDHQAIPAQNGEMSAEMLSCGTPIPNCQIRIMDDRFQPLPDRHVGEVAVRSDSMLSSYYRRDDLTAQVMADGWYLTGDYGYLADGELYITGRKKDLIIVGGRNIYPQDLEAIANDVPGVHAGRVVAFGVPDERLGTEMIVLVAEADTDDDDARTDIARDIRTRIARQIDQAVGNVLVVDNKWLLKTSSGKIARGANRDKYLREVGQR